MALIKSIRGYTPVIGKNCYLAENVSIIGDVTIGDDCSVWFNSVLRGDVNPIRIGNKVNIQDGSVLHTLHEKSVVAIGDNVSLGHRVVVHGAKIENNVLIGIGAIILDHSVVGENSIIAAGSVVLANTIIKPGSIYAGIPARKVKEVSKQQIREMIEKTADNYLRYSKWYR